ncbi:hypothetical protein [Streptosporangium sp. NPDC051022]|uniref:hypothetical protein n=1 Tax=Streptosporangium sp. NPDC051022 TaxID=3155752 RepID=UPI0034465198
MATTLRPLLLAATGSLAVLGTALTLRAGAVAGEFGRTGEAEQGIRSVSVPAPDGCGDGADGVPPPLGALLRMLSAPAGCPPG